MTRARVALLIPLVLTGWADDSCSPATPGGPSKSLNRRAHGTVQESTWSKRLDGRYYGHICVVRDKTERSYCFDDATQSEVQACPKGAHWPECVGLGRANTTR